jgi:hypothetical protein
VKWLSDELVEMFEDTLSIGSLDTWVVLWSELRYWDESLDPIEIDEESSLVCLIWDNGDDFFCIEVRVKLFYELRLARLTERKVDETRVSVFTDDDTLDTSSWLDSGRILSRRVHMSTRDDTGELTVEIHEDHLLVRDDSRTSYDRPYLERLDWC